MIRHTVFRGREKAGPRTIRSSGLVLFLVMTFLILYGETFILKSAFKIGDDICFSLFDDAMISMRYANHLANGHGLVWNVGEAPVEGYTNFLWVVMMAGLHLFPIPAMKISLGVQIMSLLILCINLVYVLRISNIMSGDALWPAACALVLTASYYPLNKWSLMGMETGAVTLIVTMSVYYMLRMQHTGRFSIMAYILPGIGTLVRIDVFLLFILVVFLLPVIDSANRYRHIRFGGGLLISFLAAHTLGRLWYFGELLPNTYYLKMTGFPIVFRITDGLYSAFHFMYGMNALLFLVPIGAALLRRDPKFLICAAVVITQLLYSIYTGGDITDAPGLANRFVCIVMPIFFVLMGGEFTRLCRRVFDAAGTAYRSHAALFHTGAAMTFVICLLYLNAGPSCRYLDRWLLMKPMSMVDANKYLVESAQYLEQITRPDAVVAVTWAGVLPYFLDRPVLDLLGKNDKKVARIKVDFEKYVHYSGRSRFTAFMPGHTKWDYAYSIGRLKPDVIWQLFPDDNFKPTTTALKESYPYLHKVYTVRMFDGISYFLKEHSAKVKWGAVY